MLLRFSEEREESYGFAAAPCIVSVGDIGGQAADNITAQEVRRATLKASRKCVWFQQVCSTFANNSPMEIMSTYC